MRKSFITAAVLALATTGSVMVGGSALAGCHRHCGDSDRGGDGNGGKATNNCLNIGVNALSGIGILGFGKANAGSCRASANGYGGHG